MGRLHLKKELEYTTPEVWGWLADYANIHRIHPLIARSYVEGGASCGVGALRVCEMKGGMHLKERVVEWREGSQYTVEVYDTSMPMMARSTVTLGVKPVSLATSEVFVDAEYEMKYGVVGSLVDALFMNPMLAAAMRAMLDKLEKSLATSRRRAP